MPVPIVDHVYRLRAAEEARGWLQHSGCAGDCDCDTCMLAHAFLNVYEDGSGDRPKASSDEAKMEEQRNAEGMEHLSCAFCHEYTGAKATQVVDGTSMCGRCVQVYYDTIGFTNQTGDE